MPSCVGVCVLGVLLLFFLAPGSPMAIAGGHIASKHIAHHYSCEGIPSIGVPPSQWHYFFISGQLVMIIGKLSTNMLCMYWVALLCKCITVPASLRCDRFGAFRERLAFMWHGSLKWCWQPNRANWTVKEMLNAPDRSGAKKALICSWTMYEYCSGGWE